MIQRSSVAARLSQKFFDEYKAVMKHYTIEERIELTKYLQRVFSLYIRGEEKDNEKAGEINKEHENLIKKYGKNFKYYHDGQLHHYFNFDIVLAEKEIYSLEEYNSMEEQSLTDMERRQFLGLCSNGLHHSLNDYYLQSEPEGKAPLGETPSPEENKRKGKLKRESGDNLTKLNQEQTALLYQYLQTGRFILKDEYLNNKLAGEAFSILTGYSPDALRQNFSKAELERIATKKNLTDLFNAITNLRILIDKDLKDKK